MYYCPRCKAKVPAEALYCTRCGFNATNARLNVLSHAPNTSNSSQKPDSPAQPQPGTSASQVQPRVPQVVPPTPTMPPAAPARRSIQPETRRVVHPHNANTPFTMSTPLARAASLPHNVEQVIPATPPALTPSMPQIPNTPIVATKSQTNPSIPTRPVPSHLQQPTQAHITPAHLLAIQQSPSTPSTPPTLSALATPMSPQTSRVQPGQPFAPLQPPWNTAQVSPAQSVTPQQIQPRQSERPQPVTSHSPRSAESYVATRNAAERWRTSWRNKQRSEAGPATEVSRGQSSVPEPLMAMQHSLARIRAIGKPQQKEKHISVFWLQYCTTGLSHDWADHLYSFNIFGQYRDK